uniref:DUF1700 domain-containing protein n=1 Tax=Candidatus Enterococcus willemsii TaxID=1857215 RepID=UPI00403F8100
MNRETYLMELQRYLKKLPHEDYVDAMDYFTEYFDEAGIENEQAVIAELGTPKQAASDILGQLLEKQRDTSTIGMQRTFWLAILALLAAPIGIPLALTAFLLLVTVGLLFFTLILVICSLMVAGVLAGGKLVLRGIIALPFSIPGGLSLIGLGLLLLGLGFLLTSFMPVIFRFVKKVVLKLTSLLTRRKKEAI